MQYYSFVVENGGTPMLSFTARVPDDFPRNGKFGDFDVRRLTFSRRTRPDRTLENDLVLRQNPILMDMDADEQKDAARARPQRAEVHRRMLGHQPDGLGDGMGRHQFHPAADPRHPRARRQQGQRHSAAARPRSAITRVIAVPSQTMPAVVQTWRPRRHSGSAPSRRRREFQSVRHRRRHTRLPRRGTRMGGP